MSSIFSDGALHPGRDPNDAWWIVVRRPEDWGEDPRPAAEYHTRYDAQRFELSLEPLPMSSAEGGAQLAPASVTAPDGTTYSVDAQHGRVLRRLSCDAQSEPLRGVGGLGSTAGRFCSPGGLALDERGLLYVADTGNHRVQVLAVNEEPVRVVVVLPSPSPVHVSVTPKRIYLVDMDGAVHTYDRSFRAGPGFVARSAPPNADAVRAIATAHVADDLVVVDALSSSFMRFDCNGRYRGALSQGEIPDTLLPLVARLRFSSEGTRVVGPIDGGTEALAWHQVALDVELPIGTSIAVQTWAADAQSVLPPALPMAPTLPVVTPWAPDPAVRMPLRVDGVPSEPPRGELVRPILSDTATWERARGAPYLRGRRLTLTGNGPNLDAGFTLPALEARYLRQGDGVTFVSGTSSERATVSSIGDGAVALIATGDRIAFGAGTELILLEREGRTLDSAKLYELTGSETIDLSPITSDGAAADIVFPHAVAALLWRADSLELRSGGQSARLWIDTLPVGLVNISLIAPVSADFRSGTLSISEPSGRMLFLDSSAWGTGFEPGTSIDVAWFAGTTPNQSLLTVAWSDPTTASIWTTTATPTTWTSMSPAVAARATDRGRYLWIKLHLYGALRHQADPTAFATPVVRGLRVIAPRLSYLSYLPAVFGRRDTDTPTGSVFLERFLALFEQRWTHAEGRYEALARLLNPRASDDEWLAFVASWFDLTLDANWPRARRAQLLLQIVNLYRLRGTAEGVRRAIEVYTGHRPELIEGFQVRPRAGLVLGCAGTLGCAPLGGLSTEASLQTTLLSAYAHRFTLVAFVDDDCDLDLAELQLRALLETVKPAHTLVDLELRTGHSRVGFESRVGVDFVLGQSPSRQVPLGTNTTRRTPGPVLGIDTRLAASTWAAHVSSVERSAQSNPRATQSTATPPTSFAIGNFEIR